MFRRSFASLAGILVIVLGLGHGPLGAAVSPDVVAAAKREGAVVWYTTLDAPTLAAVSTRFKQAYPEIAFEPLRLSTAEIPPRLVTEQRGGRFGVDLVSADQSQLRLLIRAGALAPYRANEMRAVAGALEPHGWWSVIYNVTTVIAWNPQKLREHGLRPPASVADLAKPEWKGRIGLNADALNWYVALSQTGPHAADIVRGIAANAPLLTTTHTGTVTQLEAGEFDVTPTAYGYLAQREKDAGRPVDYLNPLPQVVYPDSLALVKNAPHPNAARVLVEWLLSKDAQQTIADASGRSSLRPDVTGDRRVFDPRGRYVVLRDVDPDRYTAMSKEFNAILGVQGGS